MDSMFVEHVGGATIVVLLWLLREIAGFVFKLKLDKHKEAIARAVNKRLALVIWDLIGVSYTVWFAFFLFNSSAPATRRDILIACGLLLFVVLAVANLLDDLLQWAKGLRTAKAEA